jgi:hypothetical protein
VQVASPESSPTCTSTLCMMNTTAMTATSIVDLAKGCFDEPATINAPKGQDDGMLTNVNTVHNVCPITMLSVPFVSFMCLAIPQREGPVSARHDLMS